MMYVTSMRFFKTSNIALIFAVVYFISPFDLLPDLLGPIGRIDDLALLAFTLWRTLKGGPQAPPQRERATARPVGPRNSPPSPYDVFNLKPGATKAEVEARYRELAKDYHPDRVAHLGEDLRKVAHEKMIEIQKAYQQLLKGQR